MPIHTKYDRDHGVVLSNFTGHVTLWDLKEDAVVSFIIGDKHQSSLFLADTTEIRSTDIEAPDIYGQTTFYDDIKADRSIKVAILLPPYGNPIRKKVTLFESVFVEQGWHIKTFEERDAALEWLLKK
jgi:hypothetical protein